MASSLLKMHSNPLDLHRRWSLRLLQHGWSKVFIGGLYYALACWHGLSNKDRLFNWGMTTDAMCSVSARRWISQSLLYLLGSLSHLWFTYPNSAFIWQLVLQRLGISRRPTKRKQDLNLVIQHLKKSDFPSAVIFKLVLPGSIYHIQRKEKLNFQRWEWGA